MPKSVSPIPAGSSQASLYLVVRNGPEAIEFYKRAFGAREVKRRRRRAPLRGVSW